MTDAQSAAAQNRAAVQRLKRLIDSLGEAALRAADRGLHWLGARWTTQMSQRVRGPLVLYPGVKSASDRLATRTGELANSFGFTVAGDSLQRLTAAFFTTAPHAAVHEFGAKIRPVKRKFLAIPLASVLTPSGVPRYAGPLEAGAHFGDTFVHTTTNGDLYIARPDGTGGLELLYRLHPGPVEIPERLGMRTTLQNLLPRFRDQLVDALNAEVAKLGGTA